MESNRISVAWIWLSFSLLHALPYTQIGVQCILLGGILFPPIYWQTAVLLQRSGSLDNKSADYNKIAKAVSLIAKQGVNIRPLNVNSSNRTFTHSAEKNLIYFGFEGVKGIREKVIENILKLRPFSSIEDFIERVKPDVSSMVALVKAGGFDEIEPDKVRQITTVFDHWGDKKSKINGQNLLMLSRENFWPVKYEDEQKIYNFTQHLKKITPKDMKDDGLYSLDNKGRDFLRRIELNDLLEDDRVIEIGWWDSIYEEAIKPVKNYIAENQEELLERINKQAEENFTAQYFNSTTAIGQIETLGYCLEEHPFSNIMQDTFYSLEEEPVIERIFIKDERQIPMYQLTQVCGYCIAVDKLHTSFTLLGIDGPFEVKMKKEQFAHYAAQISRKLPNGKKEVIEKPWLRRGVPLVVHGMRNGDAFVAKTYKNSKMKHTLAMITGISKFNELELKLEREKGDEEEIESEE